MEALCVSDILLLNALTVIHNTVDPRLSECHFPEIPLCKEIFKVQNKFQYSDTTSKHLLSKQDLHDPFRHDGGLGHQFIWNFTRNYFRLDNAEVMTYKIPYKFLCKMMSKMILPGLHTYHHDSETGLIRHLERSSTVHWLPGCRCDLKLIWNQSLLLSSWFGWRKSKHRLQSSFYILHYA